MVKFRVSGKNEGERIDEEVEAVSIKQAKLRVGIKSGFGGSNLSSFMKNKDVIVRRIR